MLEDGQEKVVQEKIVAPEEPMKYEDLERLLTGKYA